MEANNIVLNELFMMEFYIPQSNKPILLNLSLLLEEGKYSLTDDLRKKISDLINKSEDWYPVAVERIKKELGDCTSLWLVELNILTNGTTQDFIFGLNFDVSDDEEHGRGMKMLFPSMKIIEYGDAEVSFFN